jgi:hypothetical protein
MDHLRSRWFATTTRPRHGVVGVVRPVDPGHRLYEVA